MNDEKLNYVIEMRNKILEKNQWKETTLAYNIEIYIYN